MNTKTIALTSLLLAGLTACASNNDSLDAEATPSPSPTEFAYTTSGQASPSTFEAQVRNNDGAFIGRVTSVDTKEPWQLVADPPPNTLYLTAFKVEVTTSIKGAWASGTEHDVLQVEDPAGNSIKQADVGETFLFVGHVVEGDIRSADGDRQYDSILQLRESATYQYVEAIDDVGWAVRLVNPWLDKLNFEFDRANIVTQLRQDGTPNAVYREVDVGLWPRLLQRARHPDTSVIELGTDEQRLYNG